jgi:cell division septation protein DedD
MPHLNAYKSKRSLRIDYASRTKTEDPKSKGAKVSLKKQTSKPAPSTTSQKALATTKSKAPKPAAAPKTKKPLTPEIKWLPYTIQVSAYRDPQISNRVATKLITAGDPAFTSPVDLSEKGKWYRVYIGNYNTLTEAKIAAAGLKDRKFRYVHIAKKPYTVQVGLPVSKSEAQKLKSKLKTKGYLAYSLPTVSGQDQTRVLIGAYESRAAATNLLEQLKKDGFDPKIGLR